jgi:hypothetical protein
MRHALWQNAKILYQVGAFNDDEFLRTAMLCGYTGMTKAQTKKAIKAKAVHRAVLEKERANLEMMTVNDMSSELMKVAAPDRYLILKTYLDARIAGLWEF